ncbi:MAG: SUMF1/EgtB/PvdO family nonheme iron enzyme [Candidatus Cloacimonetes bacterium]|nr:SUMF1/EgtB/PvdO family nonheme iron enzyme [Candidatus Cloacimonadota bacterium]
MRKAIIIIFILVVSGLSAIPILLNVEIIQQNEIVISWKIENPAENMKIEIGCFRKADKEIIEIPSESVTGDFGFLEKKDFYELQIILDGLPQDFMLDDYIIFPKLIYNDRIYYEMKKFKAGAYGVIMAENIIEMISSKEFYISKFEVTNEQFKAFVNADGYEFQEYWMIDPALMSKSIIGWIYQAKYRMTLPFEWSFSKNPFWKKAESNFIYGPVTNVRWFEANAFCNWMQGEMPTLEQIQVAFYNSVECKDDMFSGISIFKDNSFPLQKVWDGVSEWLMSGVEPSSASCAGCNEMFVMINNANQKWNYVVTLLKCPLFRNANLGFRFVID